MLKIARYLSMIFPNGGCANSINGKFVLNARLLNVWAFRSLNDEMVPSSYTKDMAAAIKKLGGEIYYTEYKDAGHRCEYTGFSDSGGLGLALPTKAKITLAKQSRQARVEACG